MSKKASERYPKEYKYGLKHQAVLQFLNTICRKMTYKSDFIRALLDTNYCNSRSSATRLIQSLEANKLIMTYGDDPIVQIRKLGILVAENMEDMNKVSNVNHKKINSQEDKINLTYYRVSHFINYYIKEQQMSLVEAMNEVRGGGVNTFATDMIKTYQTLYQFHENSDIRKEIKKHVENIELMKQKRALSTPNAKSPTPEVTSALMTLDSFAKKDIFITSLYATESNELVADVMVFNYARQISPARLESLRLFDEVLKKIGINHTSITILSRSKIDAQTSLHYFKKKNKTSVVTFAYFEKNEVFYISERVTANDLAVKLNEEHEQRQSIMQEKLKQEEKAQAQYDKYSKVDFDSFLTDYRLKKWIKNNLRTEGFANIINFILKHRDDFNQLEDDFKKLFVKREGVHKMDYLDLNYAEFMEFAKTDFKNLQKAHHVYVQLRDAYLLNPDVKSFHQMLPVFDIESGLLRLKKTDSIYHK